MRRPDVEGMERNALLAYLRELEADLTLHEEGSLDRLIEAANQRLKEEGFREGIEAAVEHIHSLTKVCQKEYHLLLHGMAEQIHALEPPASPSVPPAK